MKQLQLNTIAAQGGNLPEALSNFGKELQSRMVTQFMHFQVHGEWVPPKSGVVGQATYTCWIIAIYYTEVDAPKIET